jgi:steroid delta-isomerase-like uncharacterized protein
MSEQNKHISRRTYEEIWNNGNLGAADELIAGDFVGHSPPDETHGPEGIKKFATAMRNAFPDLHFTIENMIAEGDKVATLWTASGTHRGEFEGIPPTGTQATVQGITIDRIAGGKVVEGWTNWDALGLLQKLGAILEAEPA